MKPLYTTIMISYGTFFLAAKEPLDPFYLKSIYGELKEEVSAPPGLIVVSKENRYWEFKIFTGSNGWNHTSSLDKANLEGKGFSMPISTNSIEMVDGKSFVSITLTDEMLKTASLKLCYSYNDSGGNSVIRYSIKLSKLVQ